MQWLINYVRSWFCQHDWEYDGMIEYFEWISSTRPEGYYKIYHCKKCLLRKKVEL